MEIRSRILSFGIGNHCLCNFGFSHLSNGASHQKRHFSRLDVPAVRSSGVFIPTRHVYNVVFNQCDVVGGMGVRFKIHCVDNVARIVVDFVLFFKKKCIHKAKTRRTPFGWMFDRFKRNSSQSSQQRTKQDILLSKPQLIHLHNHLKASDVQQYTTHLLLPVRDELEEDNMIPAVKIDRRFFEF